MTTQSNMQTNTSSAMQDESGALAGLKVVDLMWVVAGPTATRLLADFGATVVRIESANRIETARGIGPFHNNAQGLDHSGLFGNMNVNKLGLSLNLATEEGRGVLMDLIRWCDVLCESFSPRAMRAWGMDYESLRELRPDLIMLSTCLFGQDGPLSNVAGFGTMGAAIGGFIALAGSPGDDPAGPYSAYTDYLSPRFAVPAILAALDHRDRTGEGCYIDQAQAESSLHFMSTALLDYTVNGHVPELVGNVDRQMAPHGVYACSGDDEWVAIAVRDNADWSRLCMALGQPGLADDARYADAESRLASCRRAERAALGVVRGPLGVRDGAHPAVRQRPRARGPEQHHLHRRSAAAAPRPLRDAGSSGARADRRRGGQGLPLRDAAELSQRGSDDRPR